MDCRFRCVRCGRGYDVRPTDGLCPNCPDEPVFDCSNAEGLRTFETLREDAQLEAEAKVGTVGMLAGGGLGAVGAFAIFVLTANEHGEGMFITFFRMGTMFFAGLSFGSGAEALFRRRAGWLRLISRGVVAFVISLAAGFALSDDIEASKALPVSESIRTGSLGPVACALSAASRTSGLAPFESRHTGSRISGGSAWQVDYHVECQAQVDTQLTGIHLTLLGENDEVIAQKNEESSAIAGGSEVQFRSWLSSLLAKERSGPFRLRFSADIPSHGEMVIIAPVE